MSVEKKVQIFVTEDAKAKIKTNASATGRTMYGYVNYLLKLDKDAEKL